MESTRQAKMARQIQKDVAEILLKEGVGYDRARVARPELCQNLFQYLPLRT